MRVRSPLERERLADQRLQPPGRGLGEGGTCEFAQFRGRGTPAADESDLASFGCFIRDIGERATGHAERAEPTARAQQVEGSTADTAAHAVEDPHRCCPPSG